MEEWAEVKSLLTEIRAAGTKAPVTGRWRSRLVGGRGAANVQWRGRI